MNTRDCPLPIHRPARWCDRGQAILGWILCGITLLAPATSTRTTAAEKSAVPSATSKETNYTKLQIRVPMRDGVRLATDVWLPSTNGLFPAVFLRFPYNKDAAVGLAREGAARRFAVIAQDTRGRFASEGENLPFHLDVADGADSVAWIAKQPWCNGQIGTWGGSAGAITQFQLAVNGTGEVDAQHLTVGAPNLYQVVYTGGVFRKALIEDWLRTTKFASNALSIWTSHPTYDGYWRARDASRHYRQVNAPAVHIGGYWDIFAQATIDGFVGYQMRGGPKARGEQKLIMGPWAHGVLQEKVGELTFPGAKKPPGNIHDHWRWFAHWLQGEDNGIEHAPSVAYYVIGDVMDTNAPGNLWRTSDRWPPVKTAPTRFYLHSDKSLSTTKPISRESLTFAYDPKNPAPTVGGIQLTIPAGPKDQRTVESRQDVLAFTSEVLNQPIEVTGRIQARLWVATDAPDTDFFVRLCDVYPDGRSFNLCEGALRARFREGFKREKLLQPGKVYPLDIDCWSTSVIFNRGHRIRVHVTSSSAPGFDPNPNTGERFRASERTRFAHNTLYVDQRYPSHLVLPIAKP